MKQYIQACVQRIDSGYRAECLDLPISAEAASLDEAVAGIHAAIQEFLQGKDLELMGFAPKPQVLLSFHFGPSAFADV